MQGLCGRLGPQGREEGDRGLLLKDWSDQKRVGGSQSSRLRVCRVRRSSRRPRRLQTPRWRENWIQQSQSRNVTRRKRRTQRRWRSSWWRPWWRPRPLFSAAPPAFAAKTPVFFTRQTVLPPLLAISLQEPLKRSHIQLMRMRAVFTDTS